MTMKRIPDNIADTPAQRMRFLVFMGLSPFSNDCDYCSPVWEQRGTAAARPSRTSADTSGSPPPASATSAPLFRPALPMRLRCFDLGVKIRSRMAAEHPEGEPSHRGAE